MINEDKIIKVYKELAKINSFSGKEREMADILKNKLKILGCEVKEDDTSSRTRGNTGNIIADLPGNDNYPAILLSAHMDRINSNNNIKLKIINNIIEGIGEGSGGDDLAGIVIILEVLNQLKYISIPFALKIIFTVAEEKGLIGAKNLSKNELKLLDYGFVYDAEGNPGTIINRSPVCVGVDVELYGNKKNEIYRTTTAIISKLKPGKIDKETELSIEFKKGSKYDGCLYPIVMKGQITSYNRIKIKNEIIKIRQIIDYVTEKHNCKVNFSIKNIYNDFDIDSNSSFINILTKAADNCGLNINFKKSTGGSDANIFNGMGLPTVNLGTGLKNAHSPEEKVNVGHMIKVIKYTLEIFEVIKENYCV